MPFTPFHFGPGAVIKGVLPRHFSFTVFCFANVLMDVEVLVLMARGGDRWHGYCHTYLGAAVIGLISVVIGWPICQRFLRWWCAQPDVPLKEIYTFHPEIGLVAAITGGLIGTISHVLFDSIVHGDVRPLLPFSERNPHYGLVGAGAAYGLCFAFGVLGVFLCARVSRNK